MLSTRHWFISDTHFCGHRPEHIVAFELLCEQIQPSDTLLLLGDIFEIWVSDDLATDADRKVESCIKSLCMRGIRVYFMHGNRDFMVGQSFSRRTGAALLTDPTRWQLPNGEEVLLTHGDWFCTDDAKYRRYRRLVRNPVFQFLFRHLPRKKRLDIATNIRQKSIRAHADNGNRSYDANELLIDRWFQKYKPLKTIVMGHTHLPNRHRNGDKFRWVLGDWGDTLWYATASESEGLKLYEADLELNEVQLRF